MERFIHKESINNMMKILIPNGTGPSNVGDMAMLMVLQGLIAHSFPKSSVDIHSTEPWRYIHKGKNAKHTLYSYVAFDSNSNLTKTYRLLKIWIYFLLFKFGADNVVKKLLGNDELFNLCQDYKEAQLIVFVGGGYLRSKPGFKQSLNLLMQLFMIEFSKLFSNTKIMSPISFGPFAYSWQEKLSADALRNLDVVTVREKISLAKLNKYHLHNTVLSSDHALLLNIHPKSRSTSRKIIGFTLREWFSGGRQNKFELEVGHALADFSISKKYSVQPILQVDSPKFGDADGQVLNRIKRILRTRGVLVRKTLKVTDVRSISDVYSSIDILLGMRMHSNILAALCGTPFVAISYEHKTEGIVETLGISKMCVKADDVQRNYLVYLLTQLEENLPLERKGMLRTVSRLKVEGKTQWEKIFAKINIL